MPHRFQPGQSGNPAGRKPLERTLAKALRELGEQPTTARGKSAVTNKELMALLMWEGITTGKIKFPGQAKPLLLDGKSYVALLGKLLDHVDGPPRLEMDVTMNEAAGDPVPTMEAVVAARQDVESWRERRRQEEHGTAS